jgi:hypothetical protein
VPASGRSSREDLRPDGLDYTRPVAAIEERGR